MSYKITRREVVSNTVLMAEVTSDVVPEAGWQYHSDGTHTFKYSFATWSSHVSTDFPPGLPSSGDVRSIYWYLPIGNGGVCHDVTAYAMFLGSDTEDAFFNNLNPIEKVNGAAWAGGRTVSTAQGAVTIDPKDHLPASSGATFDFQQWIVLWGSPTAAGTKLETADQGCGSAAAVYGPKGVFRPGRIELREMREGIVNKKDLIADFLDERTRRILEQIAESGTEQQAAEAMPALAEADRTKVQRQLLELRAEARRLRAFQEILESLLQRR